MNVLHDPIGRIGLEQYRQYLAAVASSRVESPMASPLGLFQQFTKLHLVGGNGGEFKERASLVVVQLPGLKVDDAKRAKREAIRVVDRCPRIETKVRGVGHCWIACKSQVVGQIWNLEYPSLENRVVAERPASRCLQHVETLT